MSASRRRFAAASLVTPPIERAPHELDRLSARFAIHCPQSLIDKIEAHAARYSRTEVFGLLLGRPMILEDERLRTIIEDFIPAEAFVASDACYVEVSVTELMRMHDACEPQMAARGLRVAGWFHTHPGHGIFMSGTDRENHRMYTQQWQVALVVDPQRRTWGFFTGPGCSPVKDECVLRAPEPVERKLIAAPEIAPAVEDPPMPGKMKPEPAEDQLMEIQAPPPKDDDPATPAAGTRAGTEPKINGRRLYMWLFVVGGSIGILAVTALFCAKLMALQKLLEDSSARLRDLQDKIHEISTRPCDLD